MEELEINAAYGVKEVTENQTLSDRHVEELKNLGFTIIKSGLSEEKLSLIEQEFEKAYEAQRKAYSEERLKAIDEHNTIRCLLSYHPVFLEVATNPTVLSVCRI